MPIIAPDAQAEQKLRALREQLKLFGRNSAKFGIEAWLRTHGPDPPSWANARPTSATSSLCPSWRSSLCSDC